MFVKDLLFTFYLKKPNQCQRLKLVREMKVLLGNRSSEAIVYLNKYNLIHQSTIGSFN